MPTNATEQKMVTKTYAQAIRDGHTQEMRRDPRVMVWGEGIAERGGNWDETLGLLAEFGPERVFDTPISELGFTGMGIGAAMRGLRPVVNLMFLDFFGEAFSQIMHQAAKWHYISGGQVRVPIVFWGVMGAGGYAGAHHSGCLYPIMMHLPGLKVVAPATPADAQGLLAAAIRDDNPVVYCASRMLMAHKGEVPEGEVYVPLGQARVVREGEDVTVVAISRMVQEAEQAAGQLAAEGISVELIDPRTLVPLDLETILASVRKTGRLVVVDEAWARCSAAAEIAATVAERAFRDLRAPVRRIETLPLPHPISEPLEQAMLPDAARIVAVVREVMGR